MKYSVALIGFYLLMNFNPKGLAYGNSLRRLLVGHIVGGVDVPIEMFPYVVTITQDMQMQCGGAIVSDRVVVTSAHCVFDDYFEVLDPAVLTVFAGSSIAFKGHRFSVCEILRHPKHHVLHYTYDIALLLLSRNFKFTSVVEKAHITESDEFRNPEYMITVTGFGMTLNGTLSGKLKMTQMKYVPSDQCERSQYRKMKMLVPKHMFCLIGLTWTSDCLGDSGSPVVWNNQLIGLVTVGRSSYCGSTVMPSMYVDLLYFKPWIQENIKKLESAHTSSCKRKMRY